MANRRHPCRLAGRPLELPRECRGSNEATKMADFDYNAEAELFPSRARASRRQPVGYRRFAHAADAIRFAIEDLPPDALIGAWLEVDEERFDGSEIRRLYDSDDYPLSRSDRPLPAPAPRAGAASAKSRRTRS